MTQYTYDDQIISDLHKDARGYRPSSDWYVMWKDSSDDQKQSIWNDLLVELDDSIAQDKFLEESNVNEFEREIAEIIKVGKDCTRERALRWMTPIEPFEHLQDIEQWVWERGILFTEVGKWAVQELKKDL
jgi:hypothetical protein